MILELKKLKKAIDVVELARMKRSTIPILSALRATATAEELKVEANDLDMVFSATVPIASADGDDLADFLIAEPRAMIGAVAAAGGDQVVIEPRPAGDAGEDAKGVHTVAIRAGQLAMSQKCGMTTADYPANQSRAGTVGFEADWSADVIKAVARVFPAISTEETRYYLNGVSMSKKEGTEWDYRFVAMDGHRLFVIDVPLPGAAGSWLDPHTKVRDVIIPRYFITAVAKIMERSKDAITFRLGNPSPSNAPDKTLAPDPGGDLSRCSIAGRLDDLKVTFDGKLIDGTYPDVSRVIPSEQSVPRVMQCDLSALRRAVLAVKIAGGKAKTPALKFEWGEGTVTVSRALGDVAGTARFEVPCAHNCKGMSAGFNGNYFLDILNALQGEEVVVAMPDCAPSKEREGHFVQVSGPTLFRDPADTAFFAVLMPMRV